MLASQLNVNKTNGEQQSKTITSSWAACQYVVFEAVELSDFHFRFRIMLLVRMISRQTIVYNWRTFFVILGTVKNLVSNIQSNSIDNDTTTSSARGNEEQEIARIHLCFTYYYYGENVSRSNVYLLCYIFTDWTFYSYLRLRYTSGAESHGTEH